jgi:hypothetical protein
MLFSLLSSCYHPFCDSSHSRLSALKNRKTASLAKVLRVLPSKIPIPVREAGIRAGMVLSLGWHLLATFTMLVSPLLALNYTNPLVSMDTPDPGCFYSPSSKLYYCAHTCNGEGALCTNDDGNFPIYTSGDLTDWQYSGVALPSGAEGAWTKDRYWAPEIHAHPFASTGNILLYTAGSTFGDLCIGIAYSPQPSGPYNASSSPLLCNSDSRHPSVGLIDATLFVDATGSYLVYKVDGNADGSESSVRSVPLVAEVAEDGGASMSIAVESSDVASHNEIIVSDLPWEGGCVEGPWLHVSDTNHLFMFYSASMYNTPTYSVGVAKSETGLVTGPWTKLGDPILHVGDAASSFSGPGHCSILTRPSDLRNFMVYHSHVGYDEPNIDTMRVLMMDEVVIGEDGWPEMRNGPVPSEDVQVI